MTVSGGGAPEVITDRDGHRRVVVVPGHADPTEVAERLVVWLRSRFGAGPSLVGPLLPIAGGYVNQIFALEVADPPLGLAGPMVLRLAPPWATPAKLEREYAVQRYAFEQGYPTPEPVLLETTPDHLGGPFIMMRRAPGDPVADDLVARPWVGPARLGSLAQLLARLHALPPDRFPAVFADPGEEVAFEWVVASDMGLALAGWLEAHRPPPVPGVVCHLDFHPVNVLAVGGMPTAVLDWENACLADAWFDVADATVVLRTGPVDVPRHLQPFLRQARQALAARFVGAYTSVSRRRRAADPSAPGAAPPDRDRLRYLTVLAAGRRLLGALVDRADDPALARGLSSPEYVDTLASFIQARVGTRPTT